MTRIGRPFEKGIAVPRPVPVTVPVKEPVKPKPEKEPIPA